MRALSFVFAMTLGSVAACGANVEPQLDDSGRPIDAQSASDAQSAGDGGTSSMDGGSTVASDLPCEVRDFLAARCMNCHGATPTAGAPSLNSWAALSASSATHPGQTQAQRSLARVMDPASPMPPGAPLAAADYAAFAAWVNAGAPQGMCSVASDGGMDPFAVPPQCSSARMWTRGNRGSQDMNPGQACIACHQTDPEAPFFSIAGTVYRTGHEPDNCYGGAATGAGTPVVEITDSAGQVIMLNVLGSGNFGTQRRITPPYRARVLLNGNAIAMATPQTNGDCNLCHTQSGTMGAPGRIILP